MSTTKPLSLCWYCRKSYTNGCSWAAELKPVKGWTAEPWTLAGGIEAYHVISCPLFKCDTDFKNEREYHAKRIEDNSAAMDLAAQIVKQACVDFVTAYKALKDPNLKKRLKQDYERYVKTRKKTIERNNRNGRQTREDDIWSLEEFVGRTMGEWRKTCMECEQFFRSHYFGVLSEMDGKKLLQRLKQMVMSKVDIQK